MSDYEKYKELEFKLRSTLTHGARLAIWQEIEALKNRHCGFPPKQTKQQEKV